jgi:hypothetical protein
MNSKLDKTKQKVEEAIQAIDSFNQTTPPDAIDRIYTNHIKQMRLYLVDMLDSLAEGQPFQPVAEHNMGWPIVDSWPRAQLDQYGLSLGQLGDLILAAEQAYRKYVASCPG